MARHLTNVPSASSRTNALLGACKMGLKSRKSSRTTNINSLVSLLNLFAMSVVILANYSIYFAFLPTACALEATYTPNPQDSVENGGDGGPLPLSTNQRRQLLELDVAIANSPDPNSTLSHVAQQNSMSVQELVGMLERNRNDLKESGQLEEMVAGLNVPVGGGGGGRKAMASASLPRRILGLFLSICVAILKSVSAQVSRSPKQFSAVALVFTLVFLAMQNAPRNGIVISLGPFSRGHTTFLMPPTDYMENVYTKKWEKTDWKSSLPAPYELKVTGRVKSKASKKTKSTSRFIGGVGMTRSLAFNASGKIGEKVTIETSREKEGFVIVSTASKMISLDDEMVQDMLMKTRKNMNGFSNGGKGEKDVNDTIMDEENEELMLHQETMQCIYDSILSLFDDRKFSEFVPDSSNSVKFKSFYVASQSATSLGYTDDEIDKVQEGAVMAVKCLGDFGRYGIQPLCFSYEEDEDHIAESPEGSEEAGLYPSRSVAFHTLKGGHFDGELRFSFEWKNEDQSSRPALGNMSGIISVTIAIPRGGRAPSTRLVESMVSSLAQSIGRSSEIRIEQALSRRAQSRTYRAQASGRAVLKRQLRFEQEKAQEEMAAERKRRWKRNNPDAGHYRPSGHRMRSPNNCKFNY